MIFIFGTGKVTVSVFISDKSVCGYGGKKRYLHCITDNKGVYRSS